MTQFLMAIIAFLITVTILIVAHEYGHFIAARLCGVKVLKFSIGFGKPIFRWYDRNKTEYALSMIPLGGYVKPLHEDNPEAVSASTKEVFEYRSPFVKMFIVVAGPLFSFLFAIIALWLMYIIGIQSVLPIIGQVRPETPAAMAGLKVGQQIIAINGMPTNNWMAVRGAIIQNVGKPGILKFKLKDLTTNTYKDYKIPLTKNTHSKQLDLLSYLGIEPKIPRIPPVISKVMPNSPAAIAGLKVDDRILFANGKSINDFNDLTKLLVRHATPILYLQLSRKGQQLNITVKPKIQTLSDGQKVGYLGIQSALIKWPANMLYKEHYVWWRAIVPAVQHVWLMSTVSVRIFIKIITGHLSWKYVGGPISIARMAGTSMSGGLIYFLQFLALISVSIAIFNLLPIPVLDGGHLVYYMAELIIGRPLSKRVQHVGLQIGICVLFVLIALAVFNDVVRF